jgi:hypothetical protein
MKLFKRQDRYDLYEDTDHKVASSAPNPFGKLSKQNCDEIFGVVDVNSEVEAIVKTICPDDRGKDVIYGTGMAVGIQCFNKAMELYQPTEIDVEIEMECKIGCDNFIFNGDKSICCGNKIKKLDSNGNLILRKL